MNERREGKGREGSPVVAKRRNSRNAAGIRCLARTIMGERKERKGCIGKEGRGHLYRVGVGFGIMDGVNKEIISFALNDGSPRNKKFHQQCSLNIILSIE